LNTILTDALQQLDLKPGESRRIRVNGYYMEIRRLGQGEESQFTEQVMVEPWFDFPEPPAVRLVRPISGPIDTPDPPIVPSEDDTA
jgi:hypothetical protein